MNAQIDRVDLHPDLARAWTRDYFGRTGFKHPLLVTRDLTRSNAAMNDLYARRRDQFDLAVALDSWDHALGLVQQPFCWQFLWEHREKFSPEAYWSYLSRMWTAAESFWEIRDLIPDMLDHRPEHRGHFSDDWGRRLLGELPPLFRVYRGSPWGDDPSWSWTLSYATAVYFARRFDGEIDECDEDHDPGVSTGLVCKEDVIGLLSGRGDYEVVVPPGMVRELDCFVFNRPAAGTPHRAEALAALRAAEAAFPLRCHSVHGPAHWLKVDHNVLELSPHVPGADLLVCRLFAYLHDCRRQDDDSDRGHGIRAAEFIERRCGKLTARLSAGQKARLLEACRRHEGDDRAEDPTVAVCLDADRLDVIKTGSVIDDYYLSTEAAKQLKWTI